MTTAPEAAAPPGDDPVAPGEPGDTAGGASAAANDGSVADPALFAALQQWATALRSVVARAISITVLEARLAALNFVLILVVAIASGLLLASAWIALFAAVVAWFHQLGLSWPMAFLLMAGINLTLAVAGGFAIYRMSNNLVFRAIRRFILDLEADDDDTLRSAARNTPPAP